MNIPTRASGCVGELQMSIYEIATEVRQTIMNITHTYETRNVKKLIRITPNTNLTQRNNRYFLKITGNCCWKLYQR